MLNGIETTKIYEYTPAEDDPSMSLPQSELQALCNAILEVENQYRAQLVSGINFFDQKIPVAIRIEGYDLVGRVKAGGTSVVAYVEAINGRPYTQENDPREIITGLNAFSQIASIAQGVIDNA